MLSLIHIYESTNSCYLNGGVCVTKYTGARGKSGTSAIMLSGETAAGDYPVQALKTMSRIAERTAVSYTHLDVYKRQPLYTSPQR